MWLLKLQLKHNCIIGNRCKQFNCTSSGYPLDHYVEGGEIHYLHFEKIGGKPEDIEVFLDDLRKEKSVTRFEANGDTVFFVCKGRKKVSMPGQLSLAAKKVFHTKPVFVDEGGLEHWEVASWCRKDITDFIQFMKQKTVGLNSFKILKVVKMGTNDLFFPQLMPKISSGQKKALDLAIKEGYYDYPRNIELAELAAIMDVAPSTYREHLRKAEKVMLPFLQERSFFR